MVDYKQLTRIAKANQNKRNNYMSSKSNSTVAEWILSFLLGGLVLMWYNHVYIQYPIAYWQLVILAAVSAFLSNMGKPWQYLMALLFCGAVVGQVLKWIGIVSLPLFHLHS